MLAELKGFVSRKNRFWLIGLLVLGMFVKIPHVYSLFNPTSELTLTYSPTLASARYEQCAKEILLGVNTSDGFSYASPLYIFALVPLYFFELNNELIFIIQSLLGIFCAFFIFYLSIKLKASRILAFIGSSLWLLYAPVTFYEFTLLPISFLSILILIWALEEFNLDSKCSWRFLTSGFVVGLVSGLRPPFILLLLPSIIRSLKRKQYKYFSYTLLGFLVPILFLSGYHYWQHGVFSPFASSTGLNLVLGHAESASGYGPPIPEYQLIENSQEDIHQVAVRVAFENGAETSSEVNKYWMNKAVNWIVNNPTKEFRLLGVKLGAFLGYKPFDTYFDLERDLAIDSSLKYLILPRYLLIAFILLGLVPFLLLVRKNPFLLLPLFIAFIASLAFVHSERYWLPAVPVTLAVASAGIQYLYNKFRVIKKIKLIVLSFFVLFLMLPGLLWPVPSIPQDQYLFNRAVKAYNLRIYILALSLFEESASISPPGSSVSILARMEALRISEAYNMEAKIIFHTEILRNEMNRADSINHLPINGAI